MLDKIKQVAEPVVKVAKDSSIGTVGKVIGGLALLAGATALTIAGTGAARSDRDTEYTHLPNESQAYDYDEAKEEIETTEEEPKEDDK